MFGEGPIDALSRDAMAGPVFAAAGQLLQRIVALPGEQARAGRP